MTTHARQSGFTLLEFLIVVALLSMAAGMILPNANPSLRDQLESAAELVETDIAYARSMAVANDSNYRISFDLPNNRFIIEHTGTNPLLENLPRSPYAEPGDPLDQHIVRFAELPGMIGKVRIRAVRALSTSPQSVTDLEFGPLGETTRPEETQIWLAVGTGAATRYLSVRVNPVTGLTTIGSFQTSDPVASGTTSPVSEGNVAGS
jgi:prepilin-type N-terminal cleavage/methylation domain-containing protein